MHADVAASGPDSLLYVLLLCLLGVLMGSTLALLFMPYERWVRRRHSNLWSVRRMWNGVFLIGIGLPLAVVPPALAGLTPGLLSDFNKAAVYILVYLVSFFAILALVHFRSRRSR
jgi:H+/Cl- antiporter ClcA